MGKDGIIAEHPTMKVKYTHEEMARQAQELREKLLAERQRVEEEAEEADREDDDDKLSEANHSRTGTIRTEEDW